VVLIDAVFFHHRHGCQGFPGFRVNERHITAFADSVGGGAVYGKGDGNGPENAVAHAHVIAHAAPTLGAHEAGQGRETADTHHDHITCLPGADAYGRQRFGAGALGVEHSALEEQRAELGGAVGTD
jgi:hypothetical protein